MTFCIPIGLLDTGNMKGIIVITVVCCAVVTSIVWVAIIYQTRRRTGGARGTRGGYPAAPPSSASAGGGTELPELGVDCASERSSCKDSGTGESARRSSDDLAEFAGLLHCPRSDHDRPLPLPISTSKEEAVVEVDDAIVDNDNDTCA